MMRSNQNVHALHRHTKVSHTKTVKLKLAVDFTRKALIYQESHR